MLNMSPYVILIRPGRNILLTLTSRQRPLRYGKYYTHGTFRYRQCCRNFKSDKDLQEHYRNSPKHPSCGCCGLGYPDDVAFREVCQPSTYTSGYLILLNSIRPSKHLTVPVAPKFFVLMRMPTTSPRRPIQAASF